MGVGELNEETHPGGFFFQKAANEESSQEPPPVLVETRACFVETVYAFLTQPKWDEQNQHRKWKFLQQFYWCQH